MGVIVECIAFCVLHCIPWMCSERLVRIGVAVDVLHVAYAARCSA